LIGAGLTAIPIFVREGGGAWTSAVQLLVGVALPVTWRWKHIFEDVRSVPDRRAAALVLVLGVLLGFGVIQSDFRLGAVKWCLTYVAMFVWAIAIIGWCRTRKLPLKDCTAYLALGMLGTVILQTVSGLGLEAGSAEWSPELTLEPEALLTPSIGTQSAAAAITLAMAFNLTSESTQRRVLTVMFGLSAVLLTGSRTYLVAALLLALIYMFSGAAQWVMGIASLIFAGAIALTFASLEAITQGIAANVRGVSALTFAISGGPGPGTWQFRQMMRNQAISDWAAADGFGKVFGNGLAAANDALVHAGYSGSAAPLNSGRILHNTFAACLLCVGVIGLVILVLLIGRLLLRALSIPQLLATIVAAGLPLMVENPLAGGPTVAGILFGAFILAAAPSPTADICGHPRRRDPHREPA
jgi:hypothetical protein